jgi:DNA-binding XRE family transcriptional regulator
MSFPSYEDITSQTLRDLQASIGLSSTSMAKLVGVSYKTWLNRVSASDTGSIKLLSKLEYAYLVDHARKLKLARSKKEP